MAWRVRSIPSWNRIEAGKVTPVIELEVPLHDAVAAVRHVAEGHAQGKAVITM